MDLIQALILAIIQGITEWLPVSSTGHLNIARNFIGLSTMEPSYVFFDFMLHIGTLLVVLTAFRNDIVKILKSIIKRDFQTDEGKLALFIIVGSIPTAIIGFILSAPLLLGSWWAFVPAGLAAVCLIIFSLSYPTLRYPGLLISWKTGGRFIRRTRRLNIPC